MSQLADAATVPFSFGQEVFKTGVTFITGVPDSEFKALISDLERNELHANYVPATREDNAVALAVGAHLAGDRPMVFMESSGFGNTVDVLTSLVLVYEVPLVLFIAWAGYKGRDVPHHNAIGEALAPMLDALDIPFAEVVLDKDRPEQVVRALGEAQARAEAQGRCVAVVGIPAKFADKSGEA
ncbi:phosphoenolpyruvate decarboxylase alpha chain, pamE [Deinococcus aerius]|uniref:Phosphoenolpyruvate decarboxylase alpha chain, pamE n=1 Tax=Deinococcus aerius TaxID=200253 RepID=A0A2I9D3F1_9DEIO|nr:thiamine pyrophosphate-binding protein [Deinococcus aerius]GBF04730.1 phosphoenolpyruvate decarboxylase alpha chain, pamE [Deinococcus aerius]